MFDPTLPQEGTPVDAVQMRSQLNGLKALIDAAPGITGVVVDTVSTLNPGDPATVNLTLVAGIQHVTFGFRVVGMVKPGAMGRTVKTDRTVKVGSTVKTVGWGRLCHKACRGRHPRTSSSAR